VPQNAAVRHASRCALVVPVQYPLTLHCTPQRPGALCFVSAVGSVLFVL
jgi:hypothetical protein